MIILISPAKSQDYSKNWDESYSSQPFFKKQIIDIIEVLKNYSVLEICSLMSISENLASLNHNRFKSFSQQFDYSNSKPAIFAYDGDVYESLDAKTLTKADLDFANKYLRIISGLYGILSPSDLIQPYRLEMMIKIGVNGSKNLYDFWQDKITSYLNQMLENNKSEYVVNLASLEYSKAIAIKNLNAKMININFKENKNGQYKVIALLAKKARGAMARFIIENKLTKIEDLKEFSVDGYEFNPLLSSENNLVFTRG